ncbi:hypothetical protein ACFW4K_18765 [Nocardiopsis alba]|uniref:hypothetical protein n=1 Tax=Nocardiopsis alba TaxID=53437 RepID=UPI00366FCCAF
MVSPKDRLRHIEESSAASRDHLRNIERSSAANARASAENTQLLQGIEYTNRMNMVYNGIIAENSARQLQTQRQQLALQQEQHALQQAVAEQTARHEFSMWRQTPEGSAFVEWQERAVSLVPFLRDRERTWLAAWEHAIGRARADVPEDERRRFASHPARLKQSGLRTASITAFAIAGLCALFLLGQLLLLSLMASAPEPTPDPDRITYEECLATLDDPDNFIMNEADCEAIKPADSSSVPVAALFIPLVLALGTGVALVVMRKTRQREAQNDPTVRNEIEARTARWGFDPLTTQGPWFPWYESQRFTGYVDGIEHMVRNGPSQRPLPSQLIPLQVPTPMRPSERLPDEVNEVLSSFQQENVRLSQ